MNKVFKISFNANLHFFILLNGYNPASEMNALNWIELNCIEDNWI